ncbi:F-box protein CPR1-like [Impatiens glandulifera]|uniref:F-box protein CPR1-like n=1 Tax=Impatiens glandulifera TaxID=253017 RepID=UPI001FB14125|nr:F-box protein CPR1-like [Impatiens glandulifera]
MSQLPDDILRIIFSKLPVKSLLRLKCVSKSWFSIITSPSFVKLHLNTVLTKNSLSLFSWDYHLHLFSANFYSTRAVLEFTRDDYQPIRDTVFAGTFCGSVNGLICILNPVDYVVYLCNPSTRKAIKLPDPPTNVSIHSTFYTLYDYQFGFDHVNKDYKVVRLGMLIEAKRKQFGYKLSVYSLTSNSWYSLEKFNHYPTLYGRSCIVSGVFYWLSEHMGEQEVIGFDLGTENCRVIKFPPAAAAYESSPCIITNLDLFEDILSLTCHYDSGAVHMWLLKEDSSMQKTWSRFISLPSPINPRTALMIESVKPIAYSECHKKVMLYIDYTCVWYTLEQELVEPIMLRGLVNLWNIQPCIESLVSLDLDVTTNNLTSHEEEENM